MIDVFFLHAIFGASLPIGKKLLTYTSPMLLTGIRMTIAGFLLIFFNMFLRKKAVQVRFELWPYYLQIIVIGVYLRYVLSYWGLQHMPAIKMGFLASLMPFAAALLSYLFFNERLTRKQWCGLGIGLCGYIPILLSNSSANIALGKWWFISWPELAGIASVFSQCYYLIISRTLVRNHNHSASVTNGMRMFGGGMLALITAFFMGPMQVSNVPEFAGWLILLIVMSNFIAHNYHIYLLKKYSVTFVTFTEFLCPLFTGLYSWYFLREAITWHYGVGFAGIVCGLYLFYQDELVVNKVKSPAKTALTA